MITETKKNSGLKPMPLWESLLLFGVPTVLLFAATHVMIPFLHKWSGLPQVVCWFICGGVIVFIPLFIFSFIFFKKEGNQFSSHRLKERFRLKPLTMTDIVWISGGIAVISILTWVIMLLGGKFIPGFSPSPSFLQIGPVTKETVWILAAWIPLFFFNIFGEELFWRGYIFPRQEAEHGKQTWWIHGTFWMIFHLSFGLNLLLTLIPIIYIQSFVVQKTKNTYSGILIHGIINGFGFLAVAAGLK
jgi:membrane protease YdiL (CAAX protease family)